jgi:hypothetical protein
VRRIISGEDSIKKHKRELEWVRGRARELAETVERELAELAKEEVTHASS